jgi:pseudaminic acid cytidylyltransferase
MSELLAIIPARGGSKRIPRKNIRLFIDRPILQYSIDAAIRTGMFSEIMVSTDDEEIADLAGSLGAEVPFLRSADTSTDEATTSEVISEVVRKYRASGRKFDFICCIYPTAPFIKSANLQKAYDILRENAAWSVVPVVKYSFPIQRSFTIENGLLKMQWPQYRDTRSQDLPAAFHDAGQFYFLDAQKFLNNGTIFNERTVGMEILETEAQDIDTETDWKLAELKYRYLMSGDLEI